MDPVRILQSLVEHLNENDIDGERLATADDPEGDSETAEVRISWGGKDLFDLTITRI
jgi:hypothetical protein